jgi:glycosyltransferase involved in cell wall biosynthesis
MAERRALTICYRAETDLSDWNARYASGSVPDLYPYGLHKLEASGFDVSWRSVPELGALRKASLVARPRRRHPEADWAIAWDEFSAIRMLGAIPRARYATGIIWATDEQGRGRRARARTISMMRSLTAADLVWVLSTAQIPGLRRFWGSRAPRIEFLRFGIAADYFTPRPLPERPSVLSLGNDRDRDRSTLLKALEIVHRERPDVRLRVQSRDSTPLPDGIERVPFLTHAELRDLYADTTVVAVATRPNLHVSGMTTALEAMSCGRPIVMTRSPGVSDYVGPDSGGILVAQGDPAQLAGGIIEALDAQAALELGRLGRAAVEDRFTTDQLSRSLAGLLQR